MGANRAKRVDFCDVGASHKGLVTGAGQYDNPYSLIICGVIDGRIQLNDGQMTQCIEFLWPVDGNSGDSVFDLIDDRFVVHDDAWLSGDKPGTAAIVAEGKLQIAPPQAALSAFHALLIFEFGRSDKGFHALQTMFKIAHGVTQLTKSVRWRLVQCV